MPWLNVLLKDTRQWCHSFFQIIELCNRLRHSCSFFRRRVTLGKTSLINFKTCNNLDCSKDTFDFCVRLLLCCCTLQSLTRALYCVFVRGSKSPYRVRSVHSILPSSPSLCLTTTALPHTQNIPIIPFFCRSHYFYTLTKSFLIVPY